MHLPLFRAARAKITTSADVQAETDRHAALLADARQDLAQLEAGRRDVLLGDNVATIRAHEDKAAELRMAVERLEARLEALGEQAVEIATAEAAAALEDRRKAVEARSAEAAAWLRDDYPAAARELVRALTALHEVEREVKAVNAALAEVGRHEGERIAGVQDRLRIFVGDNLGPLVSGQPLYAGSHVSLGSTIRLPDLTGGVEAPGWSAPPWS